MARSTLSFLSTVDAPTKASKDVKVTVGALLKSGRILSAIKASVAPAARRGVTKDDATALASYSVAEVAALLSALAVTAKATAGVLTPDMVRISTKDGAKAFVYVPLSVKVGEASRTVNVGLSIDGGAGLVLGTAVRNGDDDA